VDVDVPVSYFQMREMMDEALQRLYWACRTTSGFPGSIPDDSTGVVTTEAILKGLGLMSTTLEEPSRPPASKQGSHQSNHASQTTASVDDASFTEEDDSLGSQTPFTMPSSVYEPETVPVFASTSRPSSPSRPSMPGVTQPQPAYAHHPGPALRPPRSPPGGPGPPTPMQLRPNRKMEFAAGLGRLENNVNVDSPLDLAAFLDDSACTFPDDADFLSGGFEANAPDVPLPMGQPPPISPLGGDPNVPGTAPDGFLYPWPGSLAAAYQSTAV